MPGTPGKPTRYKTLPARSATGDTGTKLSQQPTLAGSPGTKLSRHARNSPFRRVLPEQGELFHARAANRPCRENFVPHAEPLPGQNSPSIRASRAQPVQNSPRTPQNADCGPLSARRESFIPLPPPTSRAGRRKSRTGTPPTHPPPIPHAIRLHEISTTPRNVAIPTITIQISKYSHGNCMRNWVWALQ